MILEIRHLRVVDAIIKEGTVTAAAERLHLTQPAVSHALRELESRLGVQLFRRAHRRMEPTAEGRRLFEAAETVLEEVERAETDLHRFKEGCQGILRVATQCYSGYNWIPKTMPELASTFPDVDLQLVPEATLDPIGSLLAERIDLALVHRFPQDAEIAVEPLFTDEFVVLMAPDHPLAGQPWVEASQLADERLLLHSSAEESLLLSSFLAPAGIRPKRVSQLGLPEAVLEAVKAGLGVSAMTSWMAAAEIESGAITCARLAPHGLKRSWHAAALRRRLGSPALTELIRLLRKHGPARDPSRGSNSSQKPIRRMTERGSERIATITRRQIAGA